MSDIAAFVQEFHEAYGVPIRTAPIANPPESDLRTRLLAEEVQEYYDAVEADDVVEVADALADIVYVAFGSALAHGIDLDAVLAEVHRSNMSKLGADGRPLKRDDGKVIKGPNFFPPNVAKVLGVSNDRRSTKGRVQVSDMVRMKVTIEFEYDADPDLYGTTNPEHMAEIDFENYADDLDFLVTDVMAALNKGCTLKVEPVKS